MLHPGRLTPLMMHNPVCFGRPATSFCVCDLWGAETGQHWHWLQTVWFKEQINLYTLLQAIASNFSELAFSHPILMS